EAHLVEARARRLGIAERVVASLEIDDALAESGVDDGRLHGALGHGDLREVARADRERALVAAGAAEPAHGVREEDRERRLERPALRLEQVEREHEAVPVAVARLEDQRERRLLLRGALALFVGRRGLGRLLLARALGLSGLLAARRRHDRLVLL